MKVLIIKHSWATLMAKGYKEYEFRTLKTNYRGEIFIHAAKTIDKYAAKRFEQLELEYSLGCVIAKATITDCIYVYEDFKKRSSA